MMAGSEQARHRRSSAKFALKWFAIVAAVGFVWNMMFNMLGMHLHSSALKIAGGVGAILFVICLIGALISGIVVLVQSSSQQSQSRPAQRAGLPPGWYPDQNNPKLQRHWDGQTWTSWTAPLD
jgi:protein-S-isoprenylcysteine O-methyltransferase Ste14